MRKSIHQYLELPTSWKIKENIKHSIVLMPNAADIKNADRRDPKGCALHNAACRVYNVPNCAIGGRWAYIPQRNSRGKHYIARMQATAETQKAIRAFDKTGKMPEAGFTFIPLAFSHRYKQKRKYMKAYSKEEVGYGKYTKKKLTPRRIKTRSIPMNVREAV